MKFFVTWIMLFLASGIVLAQSKPHIFIILADDLGYGDLSVTGHPRIQTPHIDSFAMHSRRLKFYAGAPNCSPSRAALLTGRVPMSLGLVKTTAVPSENGSDNFELKTNQVTIAQLLKDNGYATLHSGKWHVTKDYYVSIPKTFGFEKSNANTNVSGWATFGKMKEFVLSTLNENAEKPIFAYIAPLDTHDPIAEKLVAPYDSFLYTYQYDTITTDAACHLGNNDYQQNLPEFSENLKYYYAAVTSFDYAFGDFLSFLDSLGIRDSSIILFSSDNGPDQTTECWGTAGCNYSGNKRFLFEGGIVVPGFIQYPGRWDDGDTVSTPTGLIDILPTLASLSGCAIFNKGQLQGENVADIWDKTRFERNNPMFWNNYAVPRKDVNLPFTPNQFLFGQSAFLDRTGQYKLMLNYECLPDSSSISLMDFMRRASFRWDKTETALFDLWNNSIETVDIKNTAPDIYKSMLQEFLLTDKILRRQSPPFSAEDKR